MAAVGGNIVRFTYTGEEDIPDNVTHVTVINVTFVRARAFYEHPSIVEVICHEDVKLIETEAFSWCRSLKRLIIPGVKIAEMIAFGDCSALSDVECDKLERIEEDAFQFCYSLMSINLPSAEIVENDAFHQCTALTDVKFGNKLERFEEVSFNDCRSLERITIPLKDGIITDDRIFRGCGKLNHVDLIEGALHETIAALYLEEWRKDMREEINSINQILSNTPAGGEWDNEIDDFAWGEKAQAIRRWIESLIRKIIRFKEEHQGLLNEVATTLELVLPQDMVMNNVLPFLGLPPHTFGEEYESEEEDDSEDEEI